MFTFYLKKYFYEAPFCDIFKGPLKYLVITQGEDGSLTVTVDYRVGEGVSQMIRGSIVLCCKNIHKM